MDFCIWGRETDAEGEETGSDSSEDKQLASSVCSYQMREMCP